jgi:Fe-S-cluster containining protein
VHPPADAPDPGPPPSDPGGAIDAGDVGAWLVEVQAAIAREQASDVPCGSCTGCCTSSQFVHIGPDETDTLAHVPRSLTFPAPGLPPGHVLLGYDERGHCPMLVDGACTIYAHRPRTCRTYDCRVFTATAIEPDEAKVEIRRRVDRWRFRVATAQDRAALDAIRAAAAFLRTNAPAHDARSVPVPGNPTQLAVLAIEVHDVFLAAADGAAPTVEQVADRLRLLRDASGS